MANKGAKTYNISERELQEMMRRASEAGIAAYKNEHEETTRRKAGRLLYRTKTLLERYTQLNEYAQNSVYTLERAEEVNEGIADLEVLTKFGIFDDDKTLHNLKRSVVTVNMVMAHVNTMLEVYRKECESSASKVKQRQYRVIEYLCTSCPISRAYIIAAMSEAMIADMPACLAREIIIRMVSMSLS